MSLLPTLIYYSLRLSSIYCQLGKIITYAYAPFPYIFFACTPHTPYSTVYQNITEIYPMMFPNGIFYLLKRFILNAHKWHLSSHESHKVTLNLFCKISLPCTFARYKFKFALTYKLSCLFSVYARFLAT